MAVSIASAALCPTGTLAGAGYTTATGASNGFVCQIGNLQFSNFSETFTPVGGIGPGSLAVAPILTPLNEGFMFTAFWSAANFGGGAAGRNTEDSTINYVVTSLSGATIKDLSLQFNGAFIGDGVAHVTEQYCLDGGSTCPVTQVQNPPGVFNQNVVLASAVTSLSISKDIGVDSGNNGSASISQVSNQYSQIPEPRLVSLLLLALLGGFGLSKKLKRVDA